MTIRPSLAAVAELVPFLRARGQDEPAAGDLVATELIRDPAHLRATVLATEEARGSDDPQVLASLWWQAYAYRTGGTTLAAWAVAGSAPDPAAECGGGVGVARGRPASLVIGAKAFELDDLATLLDRLFVDHLEPLAASLHDTFPLGERLLWGNAASSIAACLSAVATAEGADPALGSRVDTVVAALPHDLASFGTWLEPDHRGYRRTTCCLWWKTTVAAGSYCDDCSLLPPPEAKAPA